MGTRLERPAVNILQACQAAGVSRRTIYNWLAAGKLEYVRTAGGSVRIYVDTLWRDARGNRLVEGSGATPAGPVGPGDPLQPTR